MKRIIISIGIIAALFATSSCGVSNAFIFNVNSNATQVQLSQKNFRIIGKVKGSADVSYVLIFGGLNKKQLFNNAYANMMDSADLSTGSRTLANIVTEEHVGGVPPFYFTRTVTVSANVIEFF
jgi:hypothetical protein